METQYYDGTKLLSLKDINGNTPEIFMVTSNRSGGKTTWFNRLAVNRFKKKGSKFALLYRYNYELDNIAEKFFKDIKGLFFPTDEMTSKSMAKGIYHELYLNEKPCGYAISINSADQIKKFSQFFSDVDMIIFDEFQSETNHYCNDEVRKFRSVHTSIARGRGKQVRYVPVYMISNPVSLLNPYYAALKISSRIRDDTRFLRGNGFVLEQGFIASASQSAKESAFNQAFGEDKYTAYSTQGVYLNDNKAFIGKPSGKSSYLATLRYEDTDYALRVYEDEGVIYCDDHPDGTFRYKISVTTDDHQINYIMLKRNDVFLTNMRYYFERGCFRFKDLRCKEAILTALSYL